MAMTNIRRVKLDLFLPILNGKVVSVPRSIALQQLRLALNEFCEESLYWEEDLGLITPDPSNRHGYELPLPRDVKPVGSLVVNYVSNDKPVPAENYWLSDPYTVVFAESFSDPVKMSIAANLKPAGNELPETLFEYFSEAICAGAAKRLVTMPKRDWSDPAMAQYYEAEFREGKSKAGREVRERFDSHHTERRINRRQTFY